MRLLVLERDGVINEHAGVCIKSPDEWRPLSGSLEAITRLTQAHYHIAVITNQSGVAQGLFDIQTLHQIHARMQRELAQCGGRIDVIYYCPHGPDDDCMCRKPRAGMLRDLAKRLQVDLTDVAVVGDALPDLQAARAVKARPILVRTGQGLHTEQRGEGLDGVEVFENLAAVVDQLLREA
jgi:D-glycero-D-manno-heptose 1,7-bisphosphate phosphatase